MYLTISFPCVLYSLEVYTVIYDNNNNNKNL